MYEDFFDLTGKPFQLNSDPRFFFRSTGHQRAMSYLRYGLQQGQGFVLVTGDIGTGKTMLVNNLFKELDESTVVAIKIVSTNIESEDLLRFIAAEVGVDYQHLTKAGLLKELEACFCGHIDEGRRVLLVIDECQNLPRASLEELRMLSNFEYDGRPIVQSFLLGQREFRNIMRSPGLEQLRQRVIAAFHLRPLSPSEIKSYIEHRLCVVGWDADPTIDGEIYGGVHEYTRGVPRRVNTLFDRLLLTVYLDEKHEVKKADLDAVIEEVEAEKGDITGEDEMPPASAFSSDMAAAGPSERARVITGDVAVLQKSIEDVHASLRALQRAVSGIELKLSMQSAVVTGAQQTAVSEEGIVDKMFGPWSMAFVATVAVIALGVGALIFMID